MKKIDETRKRANLLTSIKQNNDEKFQKKLDFEMYRGSDIMDRKLKNK